MQKKKEERILSDKYKEFEKYFNELDRIGIPYGLSDLFQKANELELEPIVRKFLCTKENKKNAN